MIVVFAALEAEVGDLKKALRLRRRSGSAKFHLYSGTYRDQEVVLAVTGLGKENAVQCGTRVLDLFPARAAFSTGFAGALRDEAELGDTIICMTQQCEGLDIPLSASSTLLAAVESARAERPRTLFTGGVSVREVCVTPARKRALGQSYGAAAVDMESYWLAALAEERRIPFLTVRTVFDAVDDDLSLLNGLVQGERIRSWRILSFVLSHPACLPSLWSYWQRARMARQNLAVAVVGLLVQLEASRQL